MIRLMLPYPPSTNRMWRRSGYVVHLSTEGKAYKQEVGWIARKGGAQPLEGPIQAQYTLHPRRTKKGTASARRIDLGNCEKIASDALNGIAWHDDKQLHRIVLQLGEALPNGGLGVVIDRFDPS